MLSAPRARAGVHGREWGWRLPGHPLTWAAWSSQMFKGPDRDIEFIYTAPSSAICGVSLDVGGKKEYLIAGACRVDAARGGAGRWAWPLGCPAFSLFLRFIH